MWDSVEALGISFAVMSITCACEGVLLKDKTFSGLLCPSLNPPTKDRAGLVSFLSIGNDCGLGPNN